MTPTHYEPEPHRFPEQCVTVLLAALEAMRKSVEFSGMRGTCPGCTAEDPERYVDARPHRDGCALAPKHQAAP